MHDRIVLGHFYCVNRLELGALTQREHTTTMVNLADGHVDTTHAVNGANGLNASHTNGVNGDNGPPRKRVVVVGLGMVAVSFM